MATIALASKGHEPLGRRARWAVGALVVVVAIDLVAIAFDVLEWRLLDRIDRGEAVTLAEGEANDARQELTGWVQIGSLVLAAFFFVRWFHRAYANLAGLGARDLRFGAGWAIGAWFVPVLNLFRPKQIANDIWRASDPDAPSEQGEDWKRRGYAGLLTLWWILFLVSGWVANLVFAGLDGETAAELKQVSVTWLAADSLDAVAALVAVLVVRAVTARQEARAARLAGERIAVGS